MSGASPPGWYPDPGTGALHWWDGRQWAEPHLDPGSLPPPPPAAHGPDARSSDVNPYLLSDRASRAPEPPGRRKWPLVCAALAGGAALVTAVVLAALYLASEVPRINTAIDGRYAIAGAPGYFTYSGPDGAPLAVGRPWGSPCKPIVFTVGSQMPQSDYTQIQMTVLAARARGGRRRGRARLGWPG